MTLRVPLQVRLTEAAGKYSRDVTAEVQDLQFRSTSPLGFAAASLVLEGISDRQPRHVSRFGELKIVDGRNAGTVWQGLQEDPANSTGGSDARKWAVSALGPGVHAKDNTRSMIYADRRVTAWIPAATSARYIQIEQGGDDSIAAIKLKVENMTAANWLAGAAGIVSYRAIADAGMLLARVACDWDTGFTSVNAEMRLATSLNNGAATVQDSDTANTAGGSLVASRGGSPAITAGHNWASLRMHAVANLTGSETSWGEFSNIAVRSILKDKNGNDIVSGYTVNTVLASEVFTDSAARYCPRFDVANATITATSFGIEQLAHQEGISPYDLWDELLTLEPGFTWHVWEKNPITGKYRIEWIAWPTSVVRYQAERLDGYSPNASAVELFDSVVVAYRDAAGTYQTVRLTQTIPELVAAGISREGYIDLEDQGSAGNATQVGNQFLAEHATPPNRGTLTVRRRIRDLLSGRFVEPWEIRPGSLIRVRGVTPRPDALNPTGIGRDAQTIFRLVATTYTANENAAVLELDSYTRTSARLLRDVVTRRRPGISRGR